jgi:hypothetical protein
MHAVQTDSEGNGLVSSSIEAPYPVTPFSWLAPLWSYVCGVIASPAAGSAALGGYGQVGLVGFRFAGDWAGRGVLAFLLGLLLIGPLLGTAWRASGQIRSYRDLPANPGSRPAPKPLQAIPYTLPGSASAIASSWLGVVAAQWQRIRPKLGTPLLRLVASTVFSLAVAAELGQGALVIAAVALLCMYARCLGGGRSAAEGPGSKAYGAACAVILVFLPVLLPWLIGNATYAAAHGGSVLVAACFALALGSCRQVHQTGTGLLGVLLPQLAVAIYFILAKQPITAAGVVLLASPQLLWSPLLEVPARRTEYFAAAQVPLAMAMLLAAWTLRYTL